MDEDVDAIPAIVDWVNLLGVHRPSIGDIGELADGEVFLKIMHMAAPRFFPGPGSVCLWRLLEGLQAHFHGRHGRCELTARRMLEQVSGGHDQVDVERLAKLVIWVTVDTEGPQRARCMEACQELSLSGQQAIMGILERFSAGANASHNDGFGGGSSTGVVECIRRLDDSSPGGRFGLGGNDFGDEQSLRRELQEERERRRAAEEAERITRSELRLADDAREQDRDEQQTLFDARVEQHIAAYVEEIHARNEELAQLRDELDVARSQAGAAERCQVQVREYRKKIEDLQSLKHTNDELQARVNEFSMTGRTGAGAVEHLHSRIEKLRAEVSDMEAQRNSAQHQVQVLTDQLAEMRRKHREAKEDACALRRDVQPAITEFNPAERSPPALSSLHDHGMRGSFLPLEAEDTTSQGVGSPRQLQTAEAADDVSDAYACGVAELRELINAKQDDLLNRLLAEKERATKFETTLNLQCQEAERLKEQNARDLERIATLEAAAAEAQSRNIAACQDAAAAAAAAEEAAETEQLRVCRDLLAQRERELQVLRRRGRAEADALVAQESLMVVSFHELGLRFHRLQVQHEALKRRFQIASKQANSTATEPVVVVA
eukprot:TRINITY_DN5607_c0_g1_i1.p1 TRINITY_DN5607_c0_g1~~TRINITY_DN5607_c0_g1_i1.p1  ORF type:complete len:606 (-),score=154.60 TRINITY_DN5607_c0_g1_i1:14-1831(-)